MKYPTLILILFCQIHTFGQKKVYTDFDSQKGFQPQQLFTGGDLNLGFSSITTNLGFSPQFGISATNWADIGVAMNFNYTSQRDPVSPDKVRLTTIGPGAFARLFPIDYIFASVKFEYNFITYKLISGGQNENFTQHLSAPSLLLGIGYAGGRVKGSNTYYYFMVSGDFLNNKNSPYIDSFERMIPVVRAGFNIGLFQGRSNGYREAVNL